MDRLKCQDEIEVFEAAMKWAKTASERCYTGRHSDERLRNILSENFNCIRFPTMPEKMFLQKVKQNIQICLAKQSAQNYLNS